MFFSSLFVVSTVVPTLSFKHWNVRQWLDVLTETLRFTATFDVKSLIRESVCWYRLMLCFGSKLGMLGGGSVTPFFNIVRPQFKCFNA